MIKKLVTGNVLTALAVILVISLSTETVQTSETSYTTTETDRAEHWYDLARDHREKANQYEASDKDLARRWDSNAKEAFLNGVKLDMKKQDAEGILKPYFKRGLIEKIHYETGQNRTPLNELIQNYENETEIIKPSLVLFYAHEPTERGKHDITKRMAIIFKRLAEMYTRKINFYAYPTPPVNPETSKNKNKLNELIDHNVESEPSIAMYSQYDVIQGEMPGEGDAPVEQIDIRQGGPSKNKWIYYRLHDPRYLDLSDWVNQNLTKPNQKHAIRYNNQPNGEKVTY